MILFSIRNLCHKYVYSVERSIGDKWSDISAAEPRTADAMLQRTWTLLVVLGTASALNVFVDLGATAGQGAWQVVSANQSVRVAATVPGGIYTDLRAAGVLTEEFYFRFNDHEYRWVGKDDWTYTRTFSVSAELAARTQINLVFHGLDTAATVTLNGQQLCGCDNMFRRYVFSVKSILDLNPAGVNTLVVTFKSAVTFAAERSAQTFVAPACVDPAFQGECHANQVRKMQAAFSWDWGPAFPSAGIWKSVMLEGFDTVIIRDTIYTFQYLPGSGRWRVDLKVHAELPATPTSGQGELKFQLETDGGELMTVSQPVTYQNAAGPLVLTTTQFVPETKVQRWWPNGLGAQPLYTSTVQYFSTDVNGNTTHTKVDRIGYRELRLVQEEVVPGAPEKGLSFYFEVNGVAVFSKGSNWIPAHVLPELGAAASYAEDLLHASAEAGFNMLRIWGGGVYETDRFYELCDELGILIWQDFLFACSMYPVDGPYLASVQAEVRDQVRRLQRHPSMALWAGNNENEAALMGDWYGTQSNFSAYKEQYITLYVDTIRPIVLEEDPSRSYAVSSPSNGLKSEEDGYIANDPYSPLYGDIHYYNYLADGWDANIYPRTRFASEFGFQSLPSLRSLQAVAGPGDLDLGLASEMLVQRQHHPGGNPEMQRQVESRLLPPGQYNFNSEQALAKFIPLTQMYQAMATKTEAECHRRWRGLQDASSGEGWTMGSLYWQLNDIWQGPTWAGIEHDGKWKMLHYFAARFYADLHVSSYVTPSGQLSVHAASDLVTSQSGLLEVSVHAWGTLDSPLFRTTFIIDVAPLSAAEVYNINLDTYLTTAGCDDIILGNEVAHARRRPDLARQSCFIKIRLLNESGPQEIAPSNFLFPAPLGEATGITKPTLGATVSRSPLPPVSARYTDALDVVVTTSAVAPFVWLDAGGLRGRFSDNGFLMTDSTTTVTFYALQPTTPAQLAASLTMSSLLDHWF